MKKQLIFIAILSVSLFTLTACGNNSDSQNTSLSTSQSSKQSLDLTKDIGAYNDGAWTQLTLQQQEQVFMNSYKKFAPNFDGKKLVPTLQTFSITTEEESFGRTLLSNPTVGVEYVSSTNTAGAFVLRLDADDNPTLENVTPSVSYQDYHANMISIYTELSGDATTYIKMLQHYTDTKDVQALRNIDYLMTGKLKITSTSSSSNPNSITRNPDYSTYEYSYFDTGTSTSSGGNAWAQNKLEELILSVQKGRGGDVSQFLNFKVSPASDILSLYDVYYGGLDTMLKVNNTGEKDSADINSKSKTYTFSTANGSSNEYFYETKGYTLTGSNPPNRIQGGIEPFSNIAYSQADNMIFFVLGNEYN